MSQSTCAHDRCIRQSALIGEGLELFPENLSKLVEAPVRTTVEKASVLNALQEARTPVPLWHLKWRALVLPLLGCICARMHGEKLVHECRAWSDMVVSSPQRCRRVRSCMAARRV